MLIITSCTGEKVAKPELPLTLRDFQDAKLLAERSSSFPAYMKLPAWRMYSGQQHKQLMAGVRVLRAAGVEVLLSIVSAGYGLLSEHELILPYEVTFAEMSKGSARAWSQQLRIAEAVRQVVLQHSLVVFLLGERYLDSIKPPLLPAEHQRFIFLTRPSSVATLSSERVTAVPAGKAEASRWGAGLIALKGRMFRLFSTGLAEMGVGLYGQLLEDSTAATFELLMEKGLVSE